MTDHVMKEIHAIKDANARRFHGNLTALVRDVQQRQARTDRVVLLAPRRTARFTRRTSAL